MINYGVFSPAMERETTLALWQIPNFIRDVSTSSTTRVIILKNNKALKAKCFRALFLTRTRERN